jgi:sulfoxide reductase catalytic subunit YedY
MLIKRPADIRSSEITDEKLYFNRREFIRAAGLAAGAAAGAGVFLGADATLSAAEPAPHGRKLENVKPSELSVTNEKANSWEQITTYNNFYEFGTDKEDPALYAKSLRTEPWSVVIEGEVAKPAKYALEDILKGETLEERIYRLRCVEAWSMVIPWVGFPLANLIKRVEPTGKAKFIEFYTLNDSTQMPGVRVPALRWPYIEGLRMDEAMHPLTILGVGLYGEVMPKQDGGSTVSRARSHSSAFASSSASRSTRGSRRRRRSTGSTRTSTRPSTTRAGRRRPSAASASSSVGRR